MGYFPWLYTLSCFLNNFLDPFLVAFLVSIVPFEHLSFLWVSFLFCSFSIVSFRFCLFFSILFVSSMTVMSGRYRCFHRMGIEKACKHLWFCILTLTLTLIVCDVPISFSAAASLLLIFRYFEVKNIVRRHSSSFAPCFHGKSLRQPGLISFFASPCLAVMIHTWSITRRSRRNCNTWMLILFYSVCLYVSPQGLCPFSPFFLWLHSVFHHDSDWINT